MIFLDSDDYLDKCAVELMLDDAIKTDADIVEAPFYHIYDDRRYIRGKEKEMKVMNTVEAIRYDLGARRGGQFPHVRSCFVKTYLRLTGLRKAD